MKLIACDCIAAMRSMPGGYVDSVVTDPPYGLEFMGKAWDKLGGDAGMSKPGIGDLEIAWPDYGGDPHGGANPTCMICGGRKRGRKRCECATPDWRVRGAPVEAHNTAAAQREWHRRWAEQAFRVLKPGGHLLAFGGTRTYHHLASALEEAGFEVRDSLHWVYGSGFPKSLDVSKAIDKKLGAERKVVGTYTARGFSDTSPTDDGRNQWAAGAVSDKTAQRTVAGSPEAAAWEGWGTALKPAHEPIVVARKPLNGTVAANVLRHGTGALNIDGCRVSTTDTVQNHARSADAAASKGIYGDSAGQQTHQTPGQAKGRWPANLLLTHTPHCRVVGPVKVKPQEGHRPNPVNVQADGVIRFNTKPPGYRKVSYTDPDGTETVAAWECVHGCPVAALDAQAGTLQRGKGQYIRKHGDTQFLESGMGDGRVDAPTGISDTGGPSRFFPTFAWEDADFLPVYYQAKANKKEREAGRPEGFTGKRWNTHPTVKPVALMRWLVRLVTPPGGLVLDPFTGSGTTGVAAHLEGFDFIGVEKDEEYCAIASARIGAVCAKAQQESQQKLFHR